MNEAADARREADRRIDQGRQQAEQDSKRESEAVRRSLRILASLLDEAGVPDTRLEHFHEMKKSRGKARGGSFFEKRTFWDPVDTGPRTLNGWHIRPAYSRGWGWTQGQPYGASDIDHYHGTPVTLQHDGTLHPSGETYGVAGVVFPPANEPRGHWSPSPHFVSKVVIAQWILDTAIEYGVSWPEDAPDLTRYFDLR